MSYIRTLISKLRDDDENYNPRYYLEEILSYLDEHEESIKNLEYDVKDLKRDNVRNMFVGDR